MLTTRLATPKSTRSASAGTSACRPPLELLTTPAAGRGSTYRLGHLHLHRSPASRRSPIRSHSLGDQPQADISTRVCGGQYARGMRAGIYIPNFGPYGDPAYVCDLAARAEEAGWDGLFIWDHWVADPPVGEPPLADPWVTLTAVAARTERLVVGPMIVPLGRRRPQKVALEAATLQRSLRSG